jgi:hypothetical protein
LQWLGRTFGATSAERRRTMPGDELIRGRAMVTTHAATIPAPPEAIWPWLVQMGWHQGGWYTAQWVDRLLFPANWPAAWSIIPELQGREVGDFIPDGPPESKCGFVIEQLEPRRLLVLHSTTHLPLTWRERLGARIDWVWSFVLDDLGDGDTRFLFRSTSALAPWWIEAAYQLVIVPADFIMSRQMMRGLAERARSVRVGEGGQMTTASRVT